MEDITSSEVAGFCVGGFLVAVALAVPKVDTFIANSQRRSLGLCERCGGLKVVSCSKCKGLGTLSKGTLSIFSGIASDRRVGQEDASVPCRDCGSKGSLNCPKCSGA